MPALPRLRRYCLYSSIFLVAAGQVERHLGHVVDAGVADVPHGDAGVGVALLDLLEALGGAQVGGGADADVFGADLFEKEELLVGGGGGGLGAEFDAGGARMHGGAGGAGIGEQRAEGPAQGDFAEISSIGHVSLSLPEAMPGGNRAGENVSVH